VAQEDRTEQATPKRREDARREGRVVHSTEVSATAVILAAIVAGSWGAPGALGESRRLMRYWVGGLGTLDLTPETVGPILREALAQTAVLAVPLFAVAAAVGVAATVAQVGWLLRLQALVPKLERVSPARGLRRIFSSTGLMNLVKALLKIGVVGYVAYRVVLRSGTGAEALVEVDLGETLRFAGLGTRRTLGWVAGALAVLAALDYLFQRRRHEQTLRMTRQEVKEEHKETEGDPQIRTRFRRVHREISRRRMLAAVPTADVVLTNPVHVAVALRYAAGTMRAPQVVAKGADELAERIKAVARTAGVPIVERRALARALFRSVKVGQEIPPALYRAVAEILAYIYSLRTRAAGATAGTGAV
jgi:flagellar biosynthetic protein FlhB